MLRDRCPQPPPTSRPSATTCPRERAQSTLEFLGTLPLLAAGAAACVQAVLLALAIVFAQSAADRAARGLPRAQVVESIPSGWRARASLRREGTQVTVRLSPPAVLPGASRILVVEASSRRVAP